MFASHTSGRHLAARLAVVACVLTFWALVLQTALLKSPTSDEPAHFIRGYVLWQTGDLDLQLGHTPWSHRLIGALLQTEPGAPDVRQLESWASRDRLAIAAELLWELGLDVDRLFLLARLPIIWLALLLGALMMSWSRRWNGRVAMLLTGVLFAFSPNLLASASLATTDLATTALYFATIYTWWSFWRRPAWWLWGVTAVLLGLALATKLTAVLLLPLMLLLAYVMTWRREQTWRRPFVVWLGLLPVAALALWAVYGFELATLDYVGFPLPAASYVSSWHDVLLHIRGGHQAFFMGDISNEGWWDYFAVSFGIKTPLVTLLLTVVALSAVALRRETWRTAAFLLLPVGALLAAATFSGLNIGYRHILPAIPFLLVLAGTAVDILQRTRATQVLLVLALVWYAWGTLRQHPHHLAYFNELVGGSPQGYRYLGDSNLDWGQDLKLLSDYIHTHDGPWLVSYSGSARPDYYGIPPAAVIDTDSPPADFAPANPAPGMYAISANHLQGVLANSDLFDWFRRQTPQAQLGYSIHVYAVTAQAEGSWIGHCLDPVPLVETAQAEQLVGRRDVRHLAFDCRQTWIFPQNGAPGWLIVPQADAWWVQALLPVPLRERLQLVYRHAPTADAPSYEIYYWAGADVAEMAQLLAEGVTRATLGDGTAVDLPYTLSDTLSLVSYIPTGDDWHTLWRVAATSDAPLSLQAHLYVAPDAPPLVADSLGFSREQWQVGDWFVQHHSFPGQPAALFLETGLLDYLAAKPIGPRLHLPDPRLPD